MNRFLAGIVVGVAICVVVVVGGVHYHDVGCWSDAGSVSAASSTSWSPANLDQGTVNPTVCHL